MMRNLAAMFAILAAVPATASARTFLDFYGGIAIPVAEDDYEDVTDESLKLGLRIGSRSVDGSFDFTPVNDDINILGGDVDISRYRLQLGGKFVRPVGRTSFIYGRASAGLDIVHYNAEGQVLGVRYDQSETDIGLALELAGGLMADVGKVRIGGQLGLPLAFHFEEDDANDPDDADLEYTGIDLDILFVLQVPL